MVEEIPQLHRSGYQLEYTYGEDVHNDQPRSYAGIAIKLLDEAGLCISTSPDIRRWSLSDTACAVDTARCCSLLEAVCRYLNTGSNDLQALCRSLLYATQSEKLLDHLVPVGWQLEAFNEMSSFEYFFKHDLLPDKVLRVIPNEESRLVNSIYSEPEDDLDPILELEEDECLTFN